MTGPHTARHRAPVVILFVAVTVIVLSFAITLARFGRQLDRLEQTTTSASATAAEARDAAVKSRIALEDALAQSRDGSQNIDVPAVVAALAAIHRIEVRLCGGPCPDPGG